LDGSLKKRFMNEPARLPSVGAKKILVMDDTATVADLIGEMLLGMGHHVELCRTVEDALDKFAPDKYDLLITDYMVPRMNGVEFSHAVRERAPEQLILLLTGSTFSMKTTTAQPLPVSGILEKPFSTDEFREAIVGLLANERPPITYILPAQERTRDSANHMARSGH
jgi:DNA-binding response OmpR family regulator